MSFIISVHFKNSFYEIFTPGINNRKISIEIPSDISGFASDFPLSFEVWNNNWSILENEAVVFLKGNDSKKTVPLESGLTISCELRPTRERFSLIVEKSYKGYSDFDKYVLKQGKITIGSADGNMVRYNTRNLVSGHHAVLDVGPDGICTLTDSSRNGTFVNGKRISGSCRLNYGDVVYIIGLKLICLGNVIAVNRPFEPVRLTGLESFVRDAESGPQPDADADDGYYQRSPRQIEPLDDETIEIEAPPNPARSRRQPLMFTVGPSLTMVIPMAAGVLFTIWSQQQSNSGMASPFMFMGIVTSVTAAVIGVFWALTNYRYNMKMEREDEARRRDMYGKYLEKIRRLLIRKHMFNKEVLDRKYPETRECLRFVMEKSRRVWERNVNHPDFLTVRLGQGQMPSPNIISIPKERFSLVDDNLAEEPANIKNEYDILKDVPVCISLTEHNLVGVIGEPAAVYGYIPQIMAAQIATCHSYTDVRMAFIYNEKHARSFEFAKWLPHTWNEDGSFRMIACDKNGVGELFYNLSSMLRTRLEEKEDPSEAVRSLPHYVIFIADPSLVENEAVMKYISAPTAQMGITTVLLYEQIDRLPNNCTVIIQSDEDYRGYYSLDSSFDGFSNVMFDGVSIEELEEYAREMSSIRVRETQSAGAIPQMLTFLDMYKTSVVTDIDIERRWLENRTYESMRAMIGYRSANSPLYLDIHEKYHGPHGLVAGTTGSGKSETLQTYILSMALSYHPYEVSFILIDYKGGGMAGSFEKLPHVAGIITNLGGNQTNRALASINSEIKRRQTVFNEYKLKHIDGYIELFRAGKVSQPMPHLLIIADEFAELKKEQPEFVRELVSASRVGRSLGVHLILATQKPSGVVDEEIWGNSKFRLCLRVQDKQDSNEMIRRPDAAYITNAGRGYFQVGNDEIFEQFQSGWSGARYEPDIPYSDAGQSDAKMINLWGKPCVVGSTKKVSKQEDGKKTTQLEAVVQHICSIAERQGIRPVDNIWLPPLPKTLSLPHLQEYRDVAWRDGIWRAPSGELDPVVGLIDDPVNQRQAALSVNLLMEGHLLVTGSGSGGKTTFLQTLLYSLVTTYSPKQLNIYIADFGSRTMGVFSSLPHVGGVVYDSETDKADKLVAMLLKELSRRRHMFSEKGIGSVREYVRLYDDVPFIVFAIDNYAAWNESCPKQEDNLILLSREAASYGIYLVITCSNSGDIRGRIRQNISCGIGLQLADRFEYEEAIGMKTEIVAEDHTPGRGLVCCPKPLEFQTALCMDVNDPVTLNMKLKEQFEQMAAAWSGEAATVIPQVPSDLSLDNLLSLPEFNEAVSSHRYIPFGYELSMAQISSVDLARTFCYTISGTSRSGKTNLLKVYMRLAKTRDDKIYVFDGPNRELEAYSREISADGYMTKSDELFDYMQTVMVPEFARRNRAKAEFVRSGSRNVDEYIASEQKIFLFINDMSAFCEAVYESERDMKGFMEQMIVRGDNHMIYLFACVSVADMTGEYNSKRLMRGFVGWKEGIHLGGRLEDQKVFDFDVPILQRGKKLPAGYGHISADGATLRVVTAIA